jgi:hypothetical protein
LVDSYEIDRLRSRTTLLRAKAVTATPSRRQKKETPMQSGTKIAVLSAVLLVMILAHTGKATAQSPLPEPVLVFLGQEFYETSGKLWTRYRNVVANAEAYPNELFAAAPKLQPCGANTMASRTWVDFYDRSGKRLYGFCALGGNNDLGGLWFALERDVLSPSWVYIEMSDRQTGLKYKSNEAETTM